MNDKCPKCGGQMVRGYIPDYARGSVLVPGWRQGRPQKSFLARVMGLGPPPGIPIGAFRCSTCGFLEFYSRDEFAPS